MSLSRLFFIGPENHGSGDGCNERAVRQYESVRSDKNE